MERVDRLLEIMSTKEDIGSLEAAWDHLVGVVRGLGYEVSTHDPGVGWDGSTIYVQGSLRRRTYDLAHELGHLQVSNPTRRSMKEWGLGMGFNTSDCSVRMVVDSDMAQFEENCACLLSALWMHSLGLRNLEESKLVSIVYERDGGPRWNGAQSGTAMVYALDRLIEYGVVQGYEPLPTLRAQPLDPVLTKEIL